MTWETVSLLKKLLFSMRKLVYLSTVRSSKEPLRWLENGFEMNNFSIKILDSSSDTNTFSILDYLGGMLS